MLSSWGDPKSGSRRVEAKSGARRIGEGSEHEALPELIKAVSRRYCCLWWQVCLEGFSGAFSSQIWLQRNEAVTLARDQGESLAQAGLIDL